MVFMCFMGIKGSKWPIHDVDRSDLLHFNNLYIRIFVSLANND